MIKKLTFILTLLLAGRLLAQNLNNPISQSVPQGTGGTTFGALAVIANNQATTALTSSTTVPLFIVTSATNSISGVPAFLAIAGLAQCAAFDSSFSTTPGVTPYVVASTSSGGECHAVNGPLPNGQGYAGTLMASGTSIGQPAYVLAQPGTWQGGGGGGGGGLTDFSAGDLSPLFTTNVASSTSTPDLTFSLSNAAPNSVLAGPASGGAAPPSYQTAPTISAANMTNFPTLNQSTTGTSAGIAGSQTANTFYAAPNGAPGTAGFRAIVAADVPTLNQNTTGTASNLTAAALLPTGTTAATPAPGDASALLVNTSFTSTDAFAMGYTNVLTGSGADPCIKARAVATGTFNSYVWPVSGSITCTVDPTGGFDTQSGGMWTTGMDLYIVPEGSNGATINISTPWDLRYPSMAVYSPPGRGAVSSAGNTGIRLAASAAFGSLAANRIWCSSSSDFSSAAGCQSVGTSTIAIAAEGTDAHCFNVTYESSAPATAYLVRGGELVQLAGFSNSGNDGAYIVTNVGSTSCPARLTITSSTVAFTVYSNTMVVCAAGSCGSHATVIAPTYMVYLGPRPQDKGSNGHDCIGYDGGVTDGSSSTCVWNGTSGGGLYSFSDLLKNIGLTANGYPGVAGVLDAFADEGSGYLNDTSTVTRVPFPSFVSTPFAGGQSQNNSGVSFIEAYCNTNLQTGEVQSCGNAAGYALNNAGAAGTNITNEVAVWGIGVWGKNLVDTATLYAPGRCAVEVDSEAGLSGPEAISRLHIQSYAIGICIARQDVNQGVVTINDVHGTTLGTCPSCANSLVTIFNHSYAGSTPDATVDIHGISFNASGGGGTVNATIENDNTSNWTDSSIASYSYNTKGGTVTEFSSSNQHPWTIGAESGNTNSVACYVAGGQLGHCTGAYSSGTCTCTSP